MSTMTCPPAPLPLHRAWPHLLWAKLLTRWQRWQRRRSEAQWVADYADLAHLPEPTLRDIGAPDWVHARERGVRLWELERGRW